MQLQLLIEDLPAILLILIFPHINLYSSEYSPMAYIPLFIPIDIKSCFISRFTFSMKEKQIASEEVGAAAFAVYSRFVPNYSPSPNS